MNCTIKLKSTLIKHGQGNVKQRNSAAAVGKLRALTNMLNSKTTNSKKSVGKKAINSDPKDYFTNTSSTRSMIIFDGEFNHQWDYMNKTHRALINCTDFDYRQAKVNYKEFKDNYDSELMKRISGKIIPPEVSVERQRALASKSFSCWKHQLTFIIWSDEKFDGGTYDSDRGVWVAATVAKAVYTMAPLSVDQAESVKLGSETITKASSIARAITLVKVEVGESMRLRPLKKEEDLDKYL